MYIVLYVRKYQYHLHWLNFIGLFFQITKADSYVSKSYFIFTSAVFGNQLANACRYPPAQFSLN